MRSHKQINHFARTSYHLNIGRNRKPRKEITTCLELETHFLDSLLNHGMMESIRICRFKTFLEQCFDKEPSCPFLLTITC